MKLYWCIPDFGGQLSHNVFSGYGSTTNQVKLLIKAVVVPQYAAILFYFYTLRDIVADTVDQ